MIDEVEDILGPVSKPRNKGLRKVPPPKKPRSALTRGVDVAPAADTMGGVTVFWLAKAFGMEVATVRKRMADCPPMAKKTSGYLYSLPVAAQYLVRPKVDLEHYLEGLKPLDLPQNLQASYWESQLKRTKFETLMKDLWHTADVMEVFAEVFKVVKFSIQLWPDAVERQGDLTEDERELLVEMCDGLQDEIYKSIAKMTKEKSTPNALKRFEDSVGDRGRRKIEIIDDDDVEDIL